MPDTWHPPPQNRVTGQQILKNCEVPNHVVRAAAPNDREPQRSTKGKSLRHGDKEPSPVKRARTETTERSSRREGNEEGEVSGEAAEEGAKRQSDPSVRAVGGGGGDGMGRERVVEGVNAIVTSGQLIPTLTKLMLFKLNHLVAPSAGA